MKDKILNGRTLIVDEDRTVRLDILYEEKEAREGRDGGDFMDSPEGVFLDVREIHEKYIEEIRTYW